MFCTRKLVGMTICVSMLMAQPGRAATDHVLLGDIDRSASDRGSGSFSGRSGVWDFFLYGGTSKVEEFQSGMVTEPVQTTIEFANYTFLLTFPGISVETNSLDDGYTAGFGIHRELFSWIGLGLEAGGSFGHSETVVTGDIPYSLNGVPQGNIPFTIDYEAYTLHATPILKVGPWIPLGRSFAVKPYATGGAGWSQVQEKVIFSAAGTDVRLGRRTTSALGTQYGAGVDVRISESGLIGAQYQAQKVDFDPKDIELSNWLLRFSYLF